MVSIKYIVPFLILAICAGACGQEKPMEYSDEETSEAPTTQLKRRTFPYEAKLTDASASGLSLAAAATAFSIDLTGCASTHAVTVTQTKAFLELYEFDRNCLAKLTTFTLNGKVYVPKAGSEFDTWAAGDVAVFKVAAAVPADELTVTLISTIANPVTAAGTINYQFSEITQGATDTLGEAVVRESAGLSVGGQASPQFTINQVQLVNITAAGNGEFRIQLECDGLDLDDQGSGLLCYDVLLSSIYMTLAEDTYVGEPDETDLAAIFTAAGGGKQIDLATEAFDVGLGTPVLPHGGFITANTGDADVMVLPGVKTIIAHPNMLFVLKSGPSYTYYHIDVTTITQSNDN